MKELIEIPSTDAAKLTGENSLAVCRLGQVAIPRLIDEAGEAARFAFEEFLYGRIRNPYTRRNYSHAIGRFLAWCEVRSLQLHQVAPKDVGLYLDLVQLSPATKKLHLAAIRHLFDQLVVRHAVVLNPAATVRGMRYQVIEGKTPEITVQQARTLLRSIELDDVVGMRDRAIIGTLIYTAARIGAVAKLRHGDFSQQGNQYLLRFEEKNGKSRGIPVRHDLQEYLLAYRDALKDDSDVERREPLFRSAAGRTKRLTRTGMTVGDMSRMIKRRLKRAGLPKHLSAHSFRVATITNLLHQGVSLSEVQNLAGHSDPRTTRLYDRRSQQVSRNIVERIAI